MCHIKYYSNNTSKVSNKRKCIHQTENTHTTIRHNVLLLISHLTIKLRDIPFVRNNRQ